MTTFSTTTKHALRWLTGANVGSDIDAGFQALANDLDAIIAIADKGVLASRPTSTGGSPGKSGRFYYATDTLQLFFDYGTGWLLVAETDAWHTVGGGGEPAFTNFAYIAPSPATGQGTLQFRRSGGAVWLRGVATSDSTQTNPTVFTLPAGYRPTSTLRFTVGNSAGGSAVLEAAPTGVLRVLVGSGTPFRWTFDGIAIPID